MGLGMMLTLVVAILLALLVVRVPVAFALMVAGAVGLFLVDGFDVGRSSLTSVLMNSPGRFVLVVVPMFIAMGVFALHGRIAEDAFAVASHLLRRIPGGMALASLFACAGFAAVSGSSVATIVAVGRPAIHEMKRHGYHPSVAAGVIGAAGTLGVLIPPSIVLVVYGVLTRTSIGALLIAGIIPGILSAVIYATAIVVRARLRPELFGGGGHIRGSVRGAPRADGHGSVNDADPVGGVDPADGVDPEHGGVATMPRTEVRRQAISGLFKVGVLFTVVVGGIYSGVFTVIESAAIAAIAALAIMLVVQRSEGLPTLLRKFRVAIMESASLTSMVIALLVGAALFTSFLISVAAPQRFTRFALELEVPPLALVAVLLLAFIPLGMFLDPLSIIVLAVPIAFPVVSELGFDPIWFGILVVKTVEIGLITPPLGINAFVVAGAGGMPVEQAIRGVLWYVPVDLATLALLFAVPSIVTWLPGQLSGGVM